MERRLAYELAKKKQRQEKNKISNLEFMLDSLCTWFSLTMLYGAQGNRPNIFDCLGFVQFDFIDKLGG